MELMQGFEYNASPARVIFGSGTLKKLGDEISRQNLTAPLLLSTSRQMNQAEFLKKNLNGKVAGFFTEATMQTPTNVTDKALEYAKSVKADSVVSIGGGSTIGLGKAISIRTGLPHICIPTTYAGSEMTPILGETADGQKKTRSDPKILPGTVIYDVDLTMTLPASLSATSGVNAIAHSGTLPFPILIPHPPSNVTSLLHSRSPLRQEHQPHHNPPRPGRHPLPRLLPPNPHHQPPRPSSTHISPLRRLAMRHMPRQRRDVIASQTLPRPRRDVQLAPRRNTHHYPATCA